MPPGDIQKNVVTSLASHGFHRVLIKSDENCRFIGVYYITPSGEYLKNMTDVINWLDTKNTQKNIIKKNSFKFISKKLTDDLKAEYIINQNELPTELLDYVLEKKRSIAPGIVLVGNEITNQADETVSEGESPKKLKLEEDTQFLENLNLAKNKISLDDVTFINKENFEYPEVSISQHHIFEASLNCYSQRLIDCITSKYQNKIKQFLPSCDNSCAFDNFGCPRIAFECNFCLVLWHTDCSGYRWMSVDSIRLIMCDNCAMLRTIIDTTVPNLFCDIEKLFESETKCLPRASNTEIRVPPKLEPMLWLLKMHSRKRKYINAPSSLPAIQLRKSRASKSREVVRKELDKWKYHFETTVGPESVMVDTRDHVLRIQFSLNTIDQMITVLADRDCQLLLDNILVQIFAARIVLNQNMVLVPIETVRIKRPCQAVFFSLKQSQDYCQDYITRCAELRASMLSSLTGAMSAEDNRAAVTVSRTNKEVVLPISSVRSVIPIQINPVNTNSYFKIVPSNRVCIPISSCSTTLTPSTITSVSTTNAPTFIKIRQRKQDLGCQKKSFRFYNAMRFHQWNLLNLPFHVIERILSCSSLSTSDKLNCRLTNRVLKCIIDGGQVWNKLVISPSTVTGLDNMMTFFRSKVVRKITFLIDIEESFALDFLSLFISRLKMFPENMTVERFTIRFTGCPPANSSCSLSVQDVLSCCKTITALSISSEKPLTLTVSKKKLSSQSLVKLKLKNIQNISSIIQTNNDCTPNLRTLLCGDWSFSNTIEPFHLTQLTTLHMYCSQSLLLTGITALSSLISLEHLTISRPVLNENLIGIVVYLLRSRKLVRFVLKMSITENMDDVCFRLASCFDKTITDISWHIRLDYMSSNASKNFVNNLQGSVPKNVLVHASCVESPVPIDSGV